MKAIVFDTGPLISLSLNNLLWLLPKLKEKYGGKFYITKAVKREAVETPLKSKKYKFEGFLILKLIEDGVLEVYDDPALKDETKKLLDMANKLFEAQGHFVKNVHYAEVEVIAAAVLMQADCIAIDEFVTRMIIEDPIKVKERMERKLHMKVSANDDNLNNFKNQVKDVKVIRSMEIVTLAYELGFLDEYANLDIENSKKELLDAILWGVKLNGCSGMTREIAEIKKIEGF